MELERTTSWGFLKCHLDALVNVFAEWRLRRFKGRWQSFHTRLYGNALTLDDLWLLRPIGLLEDLLNRYLCCLIVRRYQASPADNDALARLGVEALPYLLVARDSTILIHNDYGVT